MPADSFVTTWGSNTKFTFKTLRSLPLLQHGCSYYHSTSQEFWWPKLCVIQSSLRAVLEYFCLAKSILFTANLKSQLANTPTCPGTLPHAKPNNRERWNGNLLAGGAAASCWYRHCNVTSEVPKFLLPLETNVKNCGDASVTKLRQAYTNLTPPKIIRHSVYALWWSLFACFVPVWHDAATPKRHHHHIMTCIRDKK
jgi:hypothetical protein